MVSIPHLEFDIWGKAVAFIEAMQCSNFLDSRASGALIMS